MVEKTSEQQTGIWQAVDLICDTPVVLILQSLWLGINRFDALHDATGLTKTVLSNRLKKLMAADIVKRQAYQSRPMRYEYVFRLKGLGLFDVALMMYRWETKWNPDGISRRFKLRHKTCGHILMPVCAVEDTLEELRPEHVRVGYRDTLFTYPPSYVKRRRQAGAVALKKEKPVIFQEIAEIFGDRWSTLIVRAAFFGVKRYDGFLKATNASTNILAERLSWLADKGILGRDAYQQHPPRFEYTLTQKGLDILPILLFMLRWVKDMFAPYEPESVLLTHSKTKKPITVMPMCSECKTRINIQDILIEY